MHVRRFGAISALGIALGFATISPMSFAATGSIAPATTVPTSSPTEPDPGRTAASQTPNPFEDSPGDDGADELLEHWNDTIHSDEERIQIVGFSLLMIVASAFHARKRFKQQRRQDHAS